MTENFTRIYFALDSADWHGHASESLWAEPFTGDDSSDIYRLMNSPFFAKGVSYYDLVRTKFNNASKRVEYAGVVERGGHSSYMIIQNGNLTEFSKYWKLLAELGCTYESAEINLGSCDILLYAVDIPPLTDIYQAYQILSSGETHGAWVFQEGSVGHRLNVR